ncbi:non-canonical purine NTP pyrophosphatase [Corallococcus exiguus]|uniref:non-canonical purine NTP pyrophosphatase n=1 Tax=Corallococcus TaxID=83461 RepID=UPI000EBF0A7B|nr:MULTISPECIES: non-canonical purine NTP pyrophosphatase [Corallococcus]NNC21179.1 non-canonical purine NTP pyrophosphatase [Corallococcus exiguus]RKH97932.1 non-canonical purine NTP pyrophosphatase [Corallococcus sp. AB030]
MTLYFCSSNPQKHADVAHFFRDSKSPPRALWQEVIEVLSSDLSTVVREKALAAYKTALVPLFVEHGGLYIDHLKGLPGPLVKPFWTALQGDICTLIPDGSSRRAHVVQMVCYCDGKKLQLFEGRVDGTIALERRGDQGIHWEPVFIPDGQSRTIGEMALDEKLAFGANAQAYAQLRAELGI